MIDQKEKDDQDRNNDGSVDDEHDIYDMKGNWDMIIDQDCNMRKIIETAVKYNGPDRCRTAGYEKDCSVETN